MEILLRFKNENFVLTNILDKELTLLEKNKDYTIIKDFSFTEEEKEKINNWCILKEDLTILETENYKIYLQNKFILEKEKINNTFESKINLFLSDYPPSEILTFETKRVEAEKYLATGSNIYIETLAAAKWRTAQKLAETIQANALAYLQAYSQLEAQKDGQIKALKEKYNLWNNI